MTLRHPAALTLAFVLITGPVLLFAETTTNDRESCIHSLNISEELAEVGTYKIRVDSCIRQREQLRLSQDRNLRNQLRVQNIQKRLTRNSRYETIRTGIEPPEQRQSWKKVYSGTENELYAAPVGRPSRRSISSHAETTRQSWLKDLGDTYHERLIKAIEACDHLTTDFWRSNCVREHMQQNAQ